VEPSERTHRRIAVQTAAAPPAAELARLVVMQRLALGMAHTMNNAFTAILGEAAVLSGAHKDDPEVEEACQVIRAEVERCARLTRALLARRTAASKRPGREADLGRIARDLRGLLRDTISRRIELEVAAPEDLVLAAGDTFALECLVLLMVQQAAEAVSSPGTLRLRVVSGGESGRHLVAVELRSAALAEEPADAWRAPEARAAAALPLQALHAVAAESGATLEVERTRELFALRALVPAAAVD
jgi:signal transduction histidine kinase